MRGQRIVAALMIMAAFFMVCAPCAVFSGEYAIGSYLSCCGCYLTMLALFLYVYMSNWR